MQVWCSSGKALLCKAAATSENWGTPTETDKTNQEGAAKDSVNCFIKIKKTIKKNTCKTWRGKAHVKTR